MDHLPMASPIPLLFITLKVTFTPTLGFNAGLNTKEITIQDINGDGFPDVLEEGANNGDIYAKLNRTGKTQLLKKVNTPLGGSWSIDYKREGNTYALPQKKWVMDKIITFDGFTADSEAGYGPDKSITYMSYLNPIHDRREREFLGFETVKVEQINPLDEVTALRYTLMNYHTENIYMKGLTKSTQSFDADDNLLRESATLYNLLNPQNPIVNFNASADDYYLQTGLSESLLDQSRLFVAPVHIITTEHEGDESLSIEERFSQYDLFGNLLQYENLGDTYNFPNGEDGYRTEIEYFYNEVPGIIYNSYGFPKNIKVKQLNSGQLLRERRAKYYYGKISEVTTVLNTNEDLNTVNLDYDDYGNLTSATLANGFNTTIGYENTVHTFPTSVTNSHGESSSTLYELLFGIPVLITDTNSQEMRTRIDNRGRFDRGNRT